MPYFSNGNQFNSLTNSLLLSYDVGDVSVIPTIIHQHFNWVSPLVDPVNFFCNQNLAAMSDITYLTKEGYDKLRNELNELKTKGRTEIAAAIQKARELGDLSENAEYDAAKDAQGLLEMRIAKLENTVAIARVLDDSDIDTSKAYILSTVRLKNLKLKKEFSYTLVSEEEADLKKGRISIKSPVGKAVLGKAVGDIAEIDAPGGKMKFEIMEITRG